MLDWLAEDFGKAIQELLFEGLVKLAETAFWFLEGAFSGSDLDDSWWAAVVGTPTQQGMVSTTLLVFAPILVLLVIIQVVLALFRQDGKGMMRAFAGAILAFPVTWLAVWVVMSLSTATDQMTSALLETQGQEATMGAFMQMFGIKINDDGTYAGVNEEMGIWADISAGIGFGMIVPFLAVGIIFLLSLMLGVMMAFRSFVLVLLACLTGIVVIGLAFEPTRSWFSGWAGMVTGLLLAKPLAAIVLIVSMTIFDYGDSTQQLLAGFVGMLIAAAMPVVAMSFFKFLPTSQVQDSDNAMKEGANAPGRNAVRGARALSRLRKR
jgi:hypothetical protein